MDQISESRLAEVHPLLADKVRQVALIVADGGEAIRVVQGLRTVQQQDELYAMGRAVDDAGFMELLHQFFQPNIGPDDTRDALPVLNSGTKIDRTKTLALEEYTVVPSALRARLLAAPGGKIVTNCPGGKSYHNFGLAVDCVPSAQDPSQPFAPDWNETHPTWKRMIEAAQSVGLNCGATWRTFKDFPHFQLTGPFPVGEPNDELRALFTQGGLPAVWAAVSGGAQNAVAGS
jgi:hypothetical protein